MSPKRKASSHSYNLRPRKIPAKVQPTVRKVCGKAKNVTSKNVKKAGSDMCPTPSAPKKARSEVIYEESDYDSDFELEDIPSAPAHRSPLPARRILSKTSLFSDDEDEDNFLIETTTPEASLENLKGMETLKSLLMKKVIGPFVKTDRADFLNMKVPRGILLSGKPGTGKSKLAEAIATEVKKRGKNVNFFVETGGCLSKFVGETERRIRDIFQKAKDTAPSIIFLDELDGIGRKRNCDGSSGSAMYTILTTLLTEMNRLPRGKVLLVAATNCIQHLDPALIRKGRFDEVFNIPIPNQEARRDILRFYFQKMNCELSNMDLEVLADETENLVGCDLEALVDDAHSNVIDRIFPDHSWMTVSQAELKRIWKGAKIHMETDVRPALNLIKMGLEATEE